MIEAYELTVICLPESRLYELVLNVVPLLEVVVNKSACIR